MVGKLSKGSPKGSLFAELSRVDFGPFFFSPHRPSWLWPRFGLRLHLLRATDFCHFPACRLDFFRRLRPLNCCESGGSLGGGMAESGIAVGPRRGGNAHESRRAPGGEAPASSGAVAAAQLRSDVGVWERRYACRRMITWCAHPPPAAAASCSCRWHCTLPFPARHTRAPSLCQDVHCA